MAQNTLLDKLVGINEATGRATRRSKKSVDLSGFQNVATTVGNYNPQNSSSSIPDVFKSLGNISTMPGESTRYEKVHPGIDVANRSGTRINNFVSGTVTEVGSNSPSWGNYIVIRDQYGNKQRYSHLYKALVPVGSKVDKGQEIGLMGSTGLSYSPSGGDASHLDYRVMDAYNKYVNPIAYVNQYGN